MGSKIEWTDETWNPVIGCEKGMVTNQNHEHPHAYQEDLAEPVLRVGKKAAGRLLDGVEHLAFPEVCNPPAGASEPGHPQGEPVQ